MTVKVGIIGAGTIAELHLKALAQVEHAQITSIFDVNQERAGQAAEKYGAQTYESAEALLDSKVDAVLICTPPFAREGLEEAAVERGIHLLAEKPVGLQLDQAKRKEQLILESGIIHSSGYCLRYLDVVQQAKQYLADKQVDLVLSYRLGSAPPLSWWSKLELSGGQLVEQSTHQLDLIRYLAGEFQAVEAIHALRSSMLKLDKDATAYDVGTVQFELKSGAIGNITSTSVSKYVGRGEVEFFGDGFYVSLNGATLRIVDDTQDITLTSRESYYLKQDAAFIEAIRKNDQSIVLGSYSDAVATLAVTLAANESAASRSRVEI